MDMSKLKYLIKTQNGTLNIFIHLLVPCIHCIMKFVLTSLIISCEEHINATSNGTKPLPWNIDSRCNVMATRRQACEGCKKLKEEYKTATSIANVFIVCRVVETFFGRNQQNIEKKITQSEILKKASALRNGKGGEVIIHVRGRRVQDRQLEFFDECVSTLLNGLITDGTPYTDVFSRQWLSEKELFGDFTEFIVLSVVQSSSSFATVEFNTKLRHDNENINPNVENILHILGRELKTVDRYPAKTTEFSADENIRNSFNENRNLEIKAFYPSADDIEKLNLVEYILGKLKLLDNITSFSKIPGGGYFYIGISEVSDPVPNKFKEKIPKITGFLFEEDLSNSCSFNVVSVIKGNLEVLKNELKDKIRKDCIQYKTVRDEETKEKQIQIVDVPDDLIEINLHKIKGCEPPRYLLQIYIRYVEGIVFSDSQGPLTFIPEEINGGSRCMRMSQKDWLKRLNEHFRITGKRFVDFANRC